MLTSDTPNSTAHFSCHFSGFARAEYPLWNPTVMAGEPTSISQAITVRGLLSDLVILVSVLLGVNNIILSHAVYIYILIIRHVTGIYLPAFS